MKSVNLTRHQTTKMLQNLRTRKLQLDRAIRELEAYADASGLIASVDPPRSLRIAPSNHDSCKQWLQ